MKEVQLSSASIKSSVKITFHGYLPQLLVKRVRGRGGVTYILDRRTSVKDICESFGIPHPEIDSIYINNQEVGFDYIVIEGDNIEVTPISEKTDFFKSSLLRPSPLPSIRFLADVNVGKLARWLRILGFDTVYENNLGDDDLAEIAGDSKRILLTRDCNLLKRKKITYGHLVRVDDPEEQIVEVVKLFNLQNLIHPYTRCLKCNGVLRPVDKQKIDQFLEPLTRKYYESFHQCELCGQVYWNGSHRLKMEKDMQSVMMQCGSGSKK